MRVIDPRYMEALTWCDFTGGNLAPYVPVLKLDSGDQWRSFGEHARMLLRQRGLDTPDPTRFEDWREWAVRFNQIVSVLN